jgi:hypothetical protein
MKGKAMAQSEVQTNMRLPSALKTWLQEQAETARRSLTAEVVHRLEESRARQEKDTNQ